MIARSPLAVLVAAIAVALVGGRSAADPNLQQAKLLASDGANGDQFGAVVAIDGNVAVVGAPLEDTGGESAGAAYVYRFVGGLWFEEAKLGAAVPTNGARFGFRVAIDGDRIAVAAIDRADGPGDSGAVHLFRLVEDVWTLEARLTPADAAAGDEFGSAVALRGDVVAVGAQRQSAVASQSGAAYVFRFDGAAWAEEQKLVASDGLINDQFGNAIAVGADRILVGAPFRNAGLSDRGAVYAYRFDGAVWSETQILDAPEPGEDHLFGSAIAIDGTRAAIGEFGNAMAGPETGAVHVFGDDGVLWSWETTLASDVPGDGDRFGFTLDLDGDILVVGAYLDDGNGTNSGAAFIFRNDLGLWSREARIGPTDPANFDFFGFSAAVSGDVIICGASFDDDGGSGSGSAYVFNRFPVEIADADCNGNQINDLIDLFVNETSEDCNGNGTPDECDIAAGVSEDANGNGIPDECEITVVTCPGDGNGDGVVDIIDLNILLSNFNQPCDP